MDALNHITEFKSSPEIRKKLEEYCMVKHFHEGDIILHENEHVKVIPIVTRGALRVMRTEQDGREILLYYIKAGESCIMSFLGGIHHELSKVKAIAEEEVEILFLPITKVHVMIKEYPEWLDYIFRLYHKRFEELLEVVNAVAFQKVDERLLHLLEKKSLLVDSKIIQVTHEQLATELGTARVVVSRLLKQLEMQKRLVLGRNKITLL